VDTAWEAPTEFLRSVLTSMAGEAGAVTADVNDEALVDPPTFTPGLVGRGGGKFDGRKEDESSRPVKAQAPQLAPVPSHHG